MCRGLRSLKTTALIDGNVDQHTAWLHTRDQIQGHQLRCLRTGNQDRPNNEISCETSPFYFERVRRGCLDATGVVSIEFLEALQVRIEDRHVGA